MKQGRSITDWAQEIQRQAEAKKDFIANTQALSMVRADLLPNSAVELKVGNNGEFPLNEHSHGQIAARLDIPKKYYDRMLKDQPDLLATNVNKWFQVKPEKRMIRTMDGHVRAFLSNRYRCIDNIGLAETILPEIMGRGDLQMASCEITERKLYLKMIYPRLEGEIRKGDVVQSGFIVCNSEIGVGRVSVNPFLKRRVCDNGMELEEFGQRRNHVGKGYDSEEEAYELYSDRTLEANDRAFFMKVLDTVKATLTESKFKMILETLKSAADRKIEGDPLKAVEVVANKWQFNETEKSGFLKHLISGGDLTAYGVAQAITRTSQDVTNYDRATDLEAIGGEVITLEPTEWKRIATAA